MTIVTGILGPTTLALSADTEETFGTQGKIWMPKLDSCMHGNWNAVMGGAGNSDFIEVVFERIRDIPHSVSTEREFRDELEKILKSIYENHIYTEPREAQEDLEFSLLIGLWVAGELSLIRTSKKITIAPRLPYVCVGWGNVAALKILDVWYRTHLSEKLLAALSAYVVSRVKKYESYCGKETDTFLLHSDGQIEHAEGEDETYFDLFENIIKDPFFDCANGQLTEEEFERRLSILSKKLRILRESRKQPAPRVFYFQRQAELAMRDWNA